MPKNKFQDVVFTIIMAAIMVYGMVVYNIALNTGIVDGTTFIGSITRVTNNGASCISFLSSL